MVRAARRSVWRGRDGAAARYSGDELNRLDSAARPRELAVLSWLSSWIREADRAASCVAANGRDCSQAPSTRTRLTTPWASLDFCAPSAVSLGISPVSSGGVTHDQS